MNWEKGGMRWDENVDFFVHLGGSECVAAFLARWEKVGNSHLKWEKYLGARELARRCERECTSVKPSLIKGRSLQKLTKRTKAPRILD